MNRTPVARLARLVLPVVVAAAPALAAAPATDEDLRQPPLAVSPGNPPFTSKAELIEIFDDPNIQYVQFRSSVVTRLRHSDCATWHDSRA